MSERPFMQLYVSDFIGDTLPLSTEEIGAYTLLLMAAHTNGSLPYDIDTLAGIARLGRQRFEAMWPDLRAYFFDVDGRWVARHPIEWKRAKVRLFGRTPLSRHVRAAVLERDGERCHYCGRTSGPFHIDHVLAVANGGTDALDNLVVACKPCNLSKGSKTVEEWL